MPLSKKESLLLTRFNISAFEGIYYNKAVLIGGEIMKIEKLSESKIKFTVSREDMERWGITVESLITDTPKARELFKILIKRAEDETGFFAKGSNLMIEAQPGKGDAIILFITNLDTHLQSLGKGKLRAKAVRQNTHFIYEFENFDDLCEFAKLKNDIEISSLYLFEKKYFLVLFKPYGAIINEYGKEMKKDEITLPYLKEHGKCIAENDALITIEKYF